MELRQRGLALVLGAGLVLLGLWGAGVVLIFLGTAAQLPDSNALDGDPCCPVPDTWVQVAGWSFMAALVVAFDAGIVAHGARLLWFGLRHRWPKWRAAVVPLVAVPGSMALIALGLVARAIA